MTIINPTFSDYLTQLNEAPLPSDWDGDIFNERIPFKKRVEYAKDRAKRLGSGSSRIAFVIPYEGRDTVLKVAKNGKGMHQNEIEAAALEDWYLRNLGLVIPLIDYDESSSTPTWIHTELAGKAKDADFIKACGGSFADVYAFMWKLKQSRSNKPGTFYKGDASKVNPESDFALALEDYIGSYDPNIGDYQNIQNWGVYDGSPVIIDMGYDDSTQKLYSGKR